MGMTDDDRLMTLEEACRFLPGGTEWTLRAAHHEGKLDLYRVGKFTYVKARDVPPLAQYLPDAIGRVYVVGYAGFIKIGFTSGPVENRIRTLQTACPEVLKVYGESHGTPELERQLHKRFATHRLEGEWFRRRGIIKKWVEAGCPI